MLAGLVKGLTTPMSPFKRAKTRAFATEALMVIHDVKVPGGTLRFHSPTARSLHDTNSLMDDGEPETIAWLDSLPEGGVLWDIGANVGAFALYAAKVRGLKVLAFEPSAQSFAALQKNIELNGLSDRIDAYCLAFDDENKLDYLYMANSGAGHSMHGFGHAENVRGAIAGAVKQAVPGLTIATFCDLFGVAPPDYVKLDVDGNEDKILRGGEFVLKGCVQSMICEIDEAERADGGAALRAQIEALGLSEVKDDTVEAVRNVVFRKHG